ncbi:FAD-binding oxidoreductase [Candidatus Nitrospira bockiana]
MPFQSFVASVDHVRNLTHDVREISFGLLEPKEIRFKAGQFISFELESPRTGRSVIRPYSIASPPQQVDRVTIVLNRIPGGVGSTYLFSLRPGDRVTFQGPAGSFYLHDRTRDCVFVATGTGIAPIRSMLWDLFESGYSAEATLYWGLRSQRDLYYQEDFGALMRAHRNFRMQVALSRPQPAGPGVAGWDGYHGRVTELVDKTITSVRNLAVYLCGNHAMIKEITASIHKKGLCPVYREIYYDDPSPQAPDY